MNNMASPPVMGASRYILLWLEAPLQSWGHDSKFCRRDTMIFPTKSGVLGMVCSALGAGGAQKDLLARFAPLRQTVISFVRVKKTAGQEKKQEREPLLRDFHMVGSGYDNKDPWETLLIPKKSNGTNPTGSGTKITYRYYLQDAAFAVALEVPEDLADDIAHALHNPAWDIYLGRKSCVPTDFICRGIFDSEEDALAEAASIAGKKGRTEDFRVVPYVPDEDDGYETITINDVPVQFGEDKRYRDRSVSLIHAE